MFHLRLLFSIVLYTGAGISGHFIVDTYKEGPCICPAISNVPLDKEWMYSVRKWYFPIGAAYNYFSIASSFQRKSLELIKIDDLTDFCLTVRLSEDNDTVMHGFGLELPYILTLAANDSSTMDYAMFDNSAKERALGRGSAVVTMTDNDSYFVTIHCWEEQQKGWIVLSTQSQLDKLLEAKIFDHIKEFGFSLKNIRTMDYSNCPVDMEDFTLVRLFRKGKEVIFNIKNYLKLKFSLIN